MQKVYDSNIEYINTVLKELEEEFKTFGTVDSNKLITIICLSREENEDIDQKVYDFIEKTFFQIIQQNCKRHIILRTPYYEESQVDQNFYSQIYGYHMPLSYPSIVEFYKPSHATDISNVKKIKENMDRARRNYDSNN